MRIVDIDVERAVDWLVRELPGAALYGVARAATAAAIHRQAPVTVRVLDNPNGLVRYRRRLERAAGELAATVHALEPADRLSDWEQDARAYAEIGSACMDLAYRMEHQLLSVGEPAGRWAVRVVHSAHELDAFLRPGSVARRVQDSYHTLFDNAVLEGWGRLLPQ